MATVVQTVVPDRLEFKPGDTLPTPREEAYFRIRIEQFTEDTDDEEVVGDLKWYYEIEYQADYEQDYHTYWGGQFDTFADAQKALVKVLNKITFK